VAALSTAGVLAASVVVLAVVGTLRLQLRNRWAMVLQWALVALDVVVVDLEVASTAVVAASEADVVGLAAAASIAAAEVDASAAIVDMAPLMERLQALAAVGLAVATEDEDLTTAALAATLTLSLCLLEEVIAAAIVEVTVELIAEAAATGTVIATALAAVVGMLDRSDLTTAVGMMSRGLDAVIERLLVEHLTGLTVRPRRHSPAITWSRQKHAMHPRI
jgi:hypothetical protein